MENCTVSYWPKTESYSLELLQGHRLISMTKLYNRVVPNRRVVRECEGLCARLLVLKRNPINDLPIWAKSASKSEW